MSKKNYGQTGPKSSQGKKNSSMNAVKHGAYSKSLLLPSEDAKAYEKKVKCYQRSLKMKDVLGQDLARLVVDHHWVAQRMKMHLMIAQKKYYSIVDPVEFAAYLGLPIAISQKAPPFFVDPNYEVSKEVRLHATKVCDQIEQLKEQLPWKYSFKYFCDKYPELKVALDEYLANNSLVPLIDEDAIEGSEVVWPAQALGIWNLDAIYSEHFYEAYADSFKLQLQVYIEEVYLKRLEKVSTQEVRKIEALGQRCQKELNAMRTSLHLAMSYSKLQAAQEGKDQAAQKKRNEMADSLLKSEG